MQGRDEATKRIEVEERREAATIERANQEARNPPYVIQFFGQVDGQTTPYDGQFLVSYDPERDGEDAWGRPMMARVEATSDVAQAKKYPSMVAAWAEWKRQSKRRPTRPWDGRPNRPLTAFNIEVLPLEAAERGEGFTRRAG